MEGNSAKKPRNRRTKFTFSLIGVNIDKVNTKYNITIISNITTPNDNDNVTKLNDIQNEKIEYYSFIDEAKQSHRCIVSMIDYTSKENVRGYCCFWDRHPFTNSPIGCPIKYIPSQAVKTYYSEISKDTYVIKENISEQKRELLEDNNDERISISSKEVYECDGVFCSFNCIMAFILDNRKNYMYNSSMFLLNKMYYSLFGENKNIVIEPAMSWRMLRCYGGIYDITQFRNNFNKSVYENHGTISQMSIGNIFEEKFKL